MEVYLDNSATTRCSDKVRAYMDELYDRAWGNPSSMHNIGVTAEREIRKARQIIARTLKVNDKDLIFTSGGTEADNLALFGTALNKSNLHRGRHIISTRIEHPAVLAPLKELEARGYEVTLLNVDKQGIVDVDELRAALREDTILVSVMYVNNEIGSVQPISKLSEAVKKKSPHALFHCDAVQAYGKYRINPKKEGIDLLSVSAHKLHGPKGTGFLYVSEKAKLDPYLFGGGQQRGMRSGTENVQGIGGMAEAARLSYDNLEEDVQRLYGLKEYFVEEMLKTEGVAGINGVRYGVFDTETELGDTGISREAVRESAPQIVSVSFEKVRAEVLLHALEERGIYVSAGSACSSNKPAVSETLKAIGLEKKYTESTVRFSFSRETKKEELEYSVSQLREILPVLGRYV